MSWFFRGLRAPLVSTTPTVNQKTDVTPQKPPEHQHQRNKSQIIVVTQNVWSHYFATPVDQLRVSIGFKQRYGATSNVMSGTSFHARLSAIASSIKTLNADVVLVQELFLLRLSPFITVSHNFIAFTDMMKDLGLVHHTDPTLSLPYYFGQNSGLVIYSRFPIKGELNIAFTPDTTERLNNKGVVGVVVDVGGVSAGGDGHQQGNTSPPHQLVGFVSTHLDSIAPNSIRFAQVDRVKNMVTTLRQKILDLSTSSHQSHVTNNIGMQDDDDVTIVVGGDFNMCPQVASEGGYDDGTQFKHLTDAMSSVNLRSVFEPLHNPRYQQDSSVSIGNDDRPPHQQLPPITIENCTLDHLYVPTTGIPYQRAMGPPSNGELHRDDQLRMIIPWRGVMMASSLDGSGSIPTGRGMEVDPARASDHLGLYTKIYV